MELWPVSNLDGCLCGARHGRNTHTTAPRHGTTGNRSVTKGVAISAKSSQKRRPSPKKQSLIDRLERTQRASIRPRLVNDHGRCVFVLLQYSVNRNHPLRCLAFFCCWQSFHPPPMPHFQITILATGTTNGSTPPVTPLGNHPWRFKKNPPNRFVTAN